MAQLKLEVFLKASKMNELHHRISDAVQPWKHRKLA